MNNNNKKTVERSRTIRHWIMHMIKYIRRKDLEEIEFVWEVGQNDKCLPHVILVRHTQLDNIKLLSRKYNFTEPYSVKNVDILCHFKHSNKHI